MNVMDLLTLAQYANTDAVVTIRALGLPGDMPGKEGGLIVRWDWKSSDCKVVITSAMLESDRWPHFAVRHHLQLAAEKMAASGGSPARRSALFARATEVLDYQRQKELLDMKLAAGVIGPQNYADQLADLLCRRNADNALWFGANRNG